MISDLKKNIFSIKFFKINAIEVHLQLLKNTVSL